MDRFETSVSRSESPDGSGGLRVANVFAINWQRSHSETLRLFGGVQTGLSEGDRVDDRLFRSLDIGASRQIDEELSLELKYRFVSQEYDGARYADDNVISLSLHKRWDRFDID
jgi:hypothetical protein